MLTNYKLRAALVALVRDSDAEQHAGAKHQSGPNVDQRTAPHPVTGQERVVEQLPVLAAEPIGHDARTTLEALRPGYADPGPHIHEGFDAADRLADDLSS